MQLQTLSQIIRSEHFSILINLSNVRSSLITQSQESENHLSLKYHLCNNLINIIETEMNVEFRCVQLTVSVDT